MARQNTRSPRAAPGPPPVQPHTPSALSRLFDAFRAYNEALDDVPRGAGLTTERRLAAEADGEAAIRAIAEALLNERLPKP